MTALRFVLGRGLLSVVVLAVLSGSSVAASPPEAPAPDRAEAPYGISAQKYQVREGRVSRYQTFSDLLAQYGVSSGQAVRLARAVRPAFDVRSIQTGQPYRVFVNPWLQEAQYLVYQISPIRYVLFDVQRPSQSRLGRRPVEREWEMVRGTIESSLYETLMANNVHPELALRLSEVFAWQIDFFRIRKGDSFRVLYEQRMVNGTRVVPGKIVAASFYHKDRRYFGFRFNDGQGPTYFDREGESLQRKLLKAPLRYTRISSGYTHSRFHPVLERYRPHLGTDYAAPTGTPVHSVGSGTVVKAGHYGPNGNYVKVRHNETYSSGYLHLSAFADGIEPGAEVQQGETIGYVGSTGMSTGPHLDYRLWKHGKAVDPYELELPPVRPVSPQHRPAFRELVEDRLDRLFPLRVFRRQAAQATPTGAPLRQSMGATADAGAYVPDGRLFSSGEPIG